MPAVARLNDWCTGHGCYPARQNDQASSDVFINSRGAHRQGDHWVSHCCKGSCHDSVLAAGSASIYVNGRQLGRVGDPVACGSSVATGSPNLFAGP
ncbi:PAAR domain-containing protein [Desulfuromonas thiophila]|uniref:PAAR domain-containing protein n=1 Tax=Desulfuromonas thiophila TaxID=57664 RepID=UPI0029F577A0|nr:PAAR domain-containing protein [Desulfuromonas thiophila]